MLVDLVVVLLINDNVCHGHGDSDDSTNFVALHIIYMNIMRHAISSHAYAVRIESNLGY